MNKVKLNVLGLSYSHSQTGAYALVLSEDGGERRIPIIIGSFEAQAIAIELEKMKPPRPLTHDLFVSFAKKTKTKVKEVVISKIEEGVFFAKILFEYNGTSYHLDSRTSDAVALALRFNCPIYTTRDIVNKAGVIVDVQKESDIDDPDNLAKTEEDIENKDDKKLSDFDTTTLKKMLKKAVEAENYEFASKLRDEINKRK